MAGELKCKKKDTSKCKLSVMTKDETTGDFIANYEPAEGL